MPREHKSHTAHAHSLRSKTAEPAQEIPGQAHPPLFHARFSLFGNPTTLRALNASIGNQAVQRLLTPKRNTSQHHTVQRWGEPEEGDITKAVKLTVKLVPPSDYTAEVSVKTVRDLVDAYNELDSAMFFDQDELMPDEEKNPYWEKWEELRDEVDHNGRTYTRFTQTDVITYEELNDFKELLQQAARYGRLGYAAFVRKDNEVKLALRLQKAKVAEAEKTAQKALRMQFLGGADGDVSSAFLWTMIDHMGTFGGTLAEGFDLPYPRLFEKILPGAISIANVVSNWSSTNPAMYGTSLEGLASLNNVISLGGLANSFFVNPGYIVTAYIGPMLTIITKMLGKLQQQLISVNDDATEILGNPLYIGSEPGGKKLWNYMVMAMHASSHAEVAKPSGDVYDYFDKFRDRFDEFNQAKHQADLKSYTLGERASKPGKPANMPTESSYLIFSELDASAFPEWLYYNRSLVWTLLYGSRNPETAKPIK